MFGKKICLENNFKEKLKFLDLDDKIKKEIKEELRDIDFKKLFE